MRLVSLMASEEATNLHSYKVPWFLYAIVVGALVGYSIIEIVHTKRDHVVELKEATNWSIFYVSIGVGFSIPVFALLGSQAGGEYLAAYAMEKALSLDNLFVMGLIFASFKVDPALERRMLNYGIAGAIVFRLVFILGGLELLKRFEWVGVIFGIILARAAWKALQEARGGDDLDEEIEFTEKRAWKAINKVVPLFPGVHGVAPFFDGHRMTTRISPTDPTKPAKRDTKGHWAEYGKIYLTMMAAIIALIEISDVVFAVDSVPAVLAVSPDRFIAYSSNVFAILGLRALFFVYQAIANRFWALSWALSGILAWIAVKMIIQPSHLPFGLPGLGVHVDVRLSLGVLFVLFVGGIVISLARPKKAEEHHIDIVDDEDEAPTPHLHVVPDEKSA